MKKIINLDMDGTWVDFYGVEGWLTDLINESTRPYEVAKPLVNLSLLARTLNKLQSQGYEINIISWTSKNGSSDFHKAVVAAKVAWIHKHIPSVAWDNLFILPYGTPKCSVSEGYLFDDEARNRDQWGEGAKTEKDLIKILRELLA